MALSNTQPNGIKQVVRGTITIAASASSGTATISAVDMQKSELRYLGLKSGDVAQPAAIELTNATTLTAYRGTATSGSNVLLYELTERW